MNQPESEQPKAGHGHKTAPGVFDRTVIGEITDDADHGADYGSVPGHSDGRKATDRAAGRSIYGQTIVAVRKSESGEAPSFSAGTVVAPMPENAPDISATVAVPFEDRQEADQTQAVPQPDGTVPAGHDSEVSTEHTVVNATSGAAGDSAAIDPAVPKVTVADIEHWQSSLREERGEATGIAADHSESGVAEPATVIWGRQSIADPESELPIRNKPVSGDASFSESDDPDFRVERKLAEGGMGVIYIARQTSLDRELAIKTLKPLTDSERQKLLVRGRLEKVEQQRRAMFVSEALITANLVHPHIIPIHDLCQSPNGMPFYSMKRVHGTPWSDRIRTMSLEENLEVLTKVSDAVAYAHHHGVVNRDLKPENTMLGEFGEVLVLDWGLAVPARKDDRDRTRSPTSPYGAGTPAYMAPELWTGPADLIGTWSDIYLLGAMLFEIMTGHPPHEFREPTGGVSQFDIFAEIDRIVRTNCIRSADVEGELMDIAMKAMDSDPRERFGSVLSFQLAIRNYEKHEQSRQLTLRGEKLVEDHRSARSEVQQPAAARRDPSSQVSGYRTLQTAVTLFEEARESWPGNRDAARGLRDARLKYAELAFDNRDYDLGLEIIGDSGDSEFVPLRRRIVIARKFRNSVKYGVIAAAAVVLMMGVWSTWQAQRIRQQNREITTLYGDKQSLEADRDVLSQQAADLRQKTDALQSEQQELVARQNALILEQQQLTGERDQLVTERDALQTQRNRLSGEKEQLEQQKTALLSQQSDLQAQNQGLAEDKQKLMADARQLEQEVALAESEMAAMSMEVAALGVQKVRAQLDLRNTAIAGLVRAADYSTALQQIETLLQDLESGNGTEGLPEDEIRQRVEELNARRRQLLHRAERTLTPVVSQVLLPDNFLVRAFADGTVQYTRAGQTDPSAAGTALTKLPEKSAQAVVGKADGSGVLLASGTTLFDWNLQNNEPNVLKQLNSPITVCRIGHGLIVCGCEDGTITALDESGSDVLWQLRLSGEIRGLSLLPDAPVIVCAASRANASCDVVAYALAGSQKTRPKRVGELRMPRGITFPPRCMEVSHDGRLMVLSNALNGSLLVLRRRGFEGGIQSHTPNAPASAASSEPGEPVRRSREQPTGGIPSDGFPFEAADAGRFMTSAEASHTRPVNSISFSADNSHFVTASDDRTVRVWSTGAGMSDGVQSELLLEGHGARVLAAAFLHESAQYVVSSGADRMTRLWDLATYAEDHESIQRDFRQSVTPTTARRRPSVGSRFAAGHRAGPNRFRLTAQSETRSRPKDSNVDDDFIVLNELGRFQQGALLSGSLLRNGRFAVTGAADGTTVLWDLENPDAEPSMMEGRMSSPVSVLDEGHDFNLAGMQFLNSDGGMIATSGYDGVLCIWRISHAEGRSGTQAHRLTGIGLVNAFAVSDDGRLLASSSRSSTEAVQSGDAGSVEIRSTESLSRARSDPPLRTFSGGHSGEITALGFSPDSRRIASGGRDGRVVVRTVSGDADPAVLRPHGRNVLVTKLVWVGDDDLLTFGMDGVAALLRVSDSDGSLSVVRTFAHDGIPIDAAEAHPEKKLFATCSVDSRKRPTQTTVRVWSVGKEEPLCVIRPAHVNGRPTGPVQDLAWTADGHRLMMVADGRIQFVSTETWQVVRVVEAEQIGIRAVASGVIRTPEGDRQQLLATFDGIEARVWDANSGSHMLDLKPPSRVRTTAVIDGADRSFILTGSDDLRAYPVSDDPELPVASVSRILRPHSGPVTDISVYRIGHRCLIATADGRGEVALWEWNDAGESPLQRVLTHRVSAAVTATAWISPDQLLATTSDGQLGVLSVGRRGMNTELLPGTLNSAAPARFSCLDVSREAGLAAAGGISPNTGESIAVIFRSSADSWLPVAQLRGHAAGGIADVAFLNRSPHLATCGTDGAIFLWNVAQLRDGEADAVPYEALQLLVDSRNTAHAAAVTALVVSPSDDILSTSVDGTAIWWRNPFRHEARTE